MINEFTTHTVIEMRTHFIFLFSKTYLKSDYFRYVFENRNKDYLSVNAIMCEMEKEFRQKRRSGGTCCRGENEVIRWFLSS